MMQPTCPNCGTIIMPGSPFCATCGNAFAGPPDTQPLPTEMPEAMPAPPPMQPGQQPQQLKVYKVLTQADRWFGGGRFSPERLEQAINSYAAYGWRVVGVTTGSFHGQITGKEREEIIVIMEADKWW